MQNFNDPSSRFATLVARPPLVTTAARRNVSLIVLGQEDTVRGRVVIGGVQTQVLSLDGGRWRAHDRTIVEQAGQRRRIIDVGRRHYHTQGDAAPITQNVVFDSRFSPICRVGTAFFSPPQATGHMSHHPLATPTQCHASRRRGADTAPKSARKLRLSSIRRSGHKQFATRRTLAARHATARPSTECRASRLAKCDLKRACARPAHAKVVSAAEVRSPPTARQEFVSVLTCHHLINFS